MGKVSFDLGFKSAELKRLDLPIEIRKPNQTLVARVLASQSVDLEKGTYFVTAKLPAGQELVERLDVTGDQTMTLSPALEDESPRASAEVAHYLGRGGGRTRFRRSFLQQQLTETLPASDAPVSPNAYLRVFSGNVLDGTYVLENAAAELTRLPQEAADTLQFSLRGAEKIKTVQLVQPGQIPVNICSAAPSGARGVIVINQAESGEFRIDAHLHHALADSLLRYYKEASLDEASLVSRSEDLLAEKIEDPVAAAVGAYALLRFSELERLHDWTRNLCDWFPWLPDGLAIRGEHLARMGQHEEAARHFTRLPERGLPLFCDGLSYAVERLKLYTRVAEDSPQPDVALAQEVRKRLWTFCKLADRRWPSLTFAGLDPARPVVEAAPVNWTDQQALAIGASQPPA